MDLEDPEFKVLGNLASFYQDARKESAKRKDGVKEKIDSFLLNCPNIKHMLSKKQ